MTFPKLVFYHTPPRFHSSNKINAVVDMDTISQGLYNRDIKPLLSLGIKMMKEMVFKEIKHDIEAEYENRLL